MISGGGTGGHIHPALAIADEIKKRHPDCSIQFVGAKGRMEMEKIPAAGYPIEGLWISGIDRNWRSLRNLMFPIKLIWSLVVANRLIRKFQPQIAIGVGGFASGPLLHRASARNIPTLIQEQNSFPGITNRVLAKRADRICAGFPGLDRWFPRERIIETGNPLRLGIAALANPIHEELLAEAHEYFSFSGERTIAFIMGGSLGAASMNQAVQRLVESHPEGLPYDLIWQCGTRYLKHCTHWLEGQLNAYNRAAESVRCLGFIDRMDLAYAGANIIASRAGAMSIAELALVGKPTILVPSPVVAEDHQTRNAQSLSDRGGAILLPDQAVIAELHSTISKFLVESAANQSMVAAMKATARPLAASAVVDEIESLLDDSRP